MFRLGRHFGARAQSFDLSTPQGPTVDIELIEVIPDGVTIGVFQRGKIQLDASAKMSGKSIAT
jgi:hypothetical protein